MISSLYRTCRVWWHDAGGDMVEGALTLPLMALIALALVNLSLAAYAACSALTVRARPSAARRSRCSAKKAGKHSVQ